MQKLGRVALWVCQAALALMFLGAGGAKFVRPMWPRMFERWGYPDHFYLIVGAVEVAAGLALLVPQLASPASLVLIVIMIGAGATHAMHGEQQAAPTDSRHVIVARRGRVWAMVAGTLAEDPDDEGRAVTWIWILAGWTGLALFLGISSSLAYMAVGNPPRWSLTIRMALARSTSGPPRARCDGPRETVSFHACDPRPEPRGTHSGEPRHQPGQAHRRSGAAAGGSSGSMATSSYEPCAQLSVLLGHHRSGARDYVLQVEQGARAARVAARGAAGDGAPPAPADAAPPTLPVQHAQRHLRAGA